MLRSLALIGLKLGAPLRVDWLYQEYGLIIHASKCRKYDFLQAVAGCVGASESESKDGIRLSFSAPELRKRHRATIEDPSVKFTDTDIRSGDFMRLSAQLTQAFFGTSTDAFLQKCFDSPNRYFEAPVTPGTEVDQIGRERMAELLSSLDREPYKSSQVGRQTRTLIDQVDFDQAFKINFAAPVRIGMAMLAKDGKLHILL